MKFISLPNHIVQDELITDTTRNVGGAHLLFAGVINVATGLVLLIALLNGRLVPTLIGESTHVLSEPELLRYGGLLDPIVALVAPAVGVGLLIVGGLEVLAGRDALRARTWRRTMAVSAAGVLNVLAAPMALIAITLLYLSRCQFER